MTDRQGRVFVAVFMTVTLGMVCAGIALPFLLHDSRWVALCLAILFYL